MPLVVRPPVDVPPWTPTAEQVEKHVPTRGPFDEHSRPSRQQVQELAVSLARGLLLDLKVETPLTALQAGVARSYVEHATAARIEWNWYPEQQDADGAGRQHDTWAAAELSRLRLSLGLSAVGGVGGAPAAPLGCFPPVHPMLLDPLPGSSPCWL